MAESIENLPKELKDNFEKAVNALKRENYDYAINLFSTIVAIKQDFARARHLLRISQRKKYNLSPPNIFAKISASLISLIYSIKAIILRLRNEPSLAIQEYEKALLLNPFNTSILMKLAKTFLFMELNKCAIFAFEEILEKNPKNLFAIKNLGRLYIEVGDYEKSRIHYKKLAEIHPHDHDAEKGLRNLDALGTIRKKFGSDDQLEDFQLRI